MLKSELVEILSDVEDVLADKNLSNSEKLDEIESIVLPDEEDDSED